jgi:CubicO group peptidase (beta-lactamase class C family)
MKPLLYGLAVVIAASLPALAQSPSAGITAHDPRFDAALTAARSLPRLHSLLVSIDRRLVIERYFNGATASRPANVKSVAKSIISALVGIAIERKLIPAVDTPIVTYFPELKRDPDRRKLQISIEDLLTMRPGR